MNQLAVVRGSSLPGGCGDDNQEITRRGADRGHKSSLTDDVEMLTWGFKQGIFGHGV